MFAPVAASSASAWPDRATATTEAPASANARAIPRPKPRLAPTTTVVLPDKSLIVTLLLCLSAGSLGVVFITTAVPGNVLVAPLWCAVEPLVHAPDCVEAARVPRIGVVDDAVLARKGTHPWRFAYERCEVGADGTGRDPVKCLGIASIDQ